MTRFAGAAPTHSIPKLVNVLRQRESSQKLMTFMLLIGGALWLFVATAFIATIPWGMQFSRRGRPITSPGSWWEYFWMTAAIAVPILFLLERATRGKLLDEAASHFEGTNPMSQRILGRGMFFVVLIEMGLWGPRSLTRAVRRMSGSKSMAGADRNTAATILANLLRGNEGLPIGQALAGLPDHLSSDALAYLAYYDWVDIAKDGSRVWILSDARKRLVG